VLSSSDNSLNAGPLELRHALENNEIIPYFQVLISLKSGTVMGFEILARWSHPVRGFIPPDEFIPIAESYDMINELTEKLFIKAVAAASQWPDHLLLCINISPSQLQDRSLVPMLNAIAVREAFPLSRVVVEVTENTFVNDMSKAREIADEIKEKGASLSLDDFGSGYASLYHLQSLPFDYIKVDAGFIREMGSHGKSRTLVAAVVALGHSLGLTIIAEGVEDKTQADMLTCFGCDIGQGWLFGRPIPAEEVSRLFDHLSPTQKHEPTSSEISTDAAARLDAPPDHYSPELQALYDGTRIGCDYLECDMRIFSLNNKQPTEMFDKAIDPCLARCMKDAEHDLADQLRYPFLRALNGQPVSNYLLKQKSSADSKDQFFLVSTEVAHGKLNEVVGFSIRVVEVASGANTSESEHDGGEY